MSEIRALEGPRDYRRDVLRNLALFNAFFTFIQAVVFTTVVPPVHQFLVKNETFGQAVSVTVLGITFTLPSALVCVLAAVLAAIFARSLRLHNALSDVLHLRESFDIRNIIIPLAGGVSYALTLDDLERLRKEPELRRQVLRHVFYDYVGSPEPKISRDLTERVLERWQWLWLTLEQIVVVATFTVLCVAFWSPWAGLWAVLLLALCLLEVQMLPRLPADTYQEVRDILENDQWRSDILARFQKHLGTR